MGCSGSREQVVEGRVVKQAVGEPVKRKNEGSAGLHYNMLRATRASNGSRFHRIYEVTYTTSHNLSCTLLLDTPPPQFSQSRGSMFVLGADALFLPGSTWLERLKCVE